MKLVIACLITFFTLTINVNASTDKIEVNLKKCVDGDTAWFIVDGKSIKTRFLAIDTPEATNKTEIYGKEASKYTCDLLTNANKIELEYDNNSNKKDKYDRHLVWVFVDDKLLQLDLIKNGYAEVAYLYGDYKYTYLLQNAEDHAKKNNLGIWNDNGNTNYEKETIFTFIITIIFTLIILLFLQKSKPRRRKV